MTSIAKAFVRTLAGAALTMGLALGLGVSFASAQPWGYGAISVDVGTLRAQGLGPYADRVQSTLQRELAAAFADRIVRGGPRLVVRLSGLSLRSYAGREGPPGYGSSANDYLEGEALVLGPGGAVLLRYPQLSALPSSSGGAWYLPDNEQRRLAAICAQFAGWLRRSL